MNGGKYSVEETIKSLRNQIKIEVRKHRGTHCFYGEYYTSQVIDILDRLEYLEDKLAEFKNLAKRIAE